METITVNGKTYYSEAQEDKPTTIKIVVLQRGWILIKENENENTNSKEN